MPTAQNKRHDMINTLDNSPPNRGKTAANGAQATSGKKSNDDNKTKKKKATKKKKKSGLAFWFCMSSKTDEVDDDSKPYPAKKNNNNKSKGKKDEESKDKKKNSGDDRKSRDKNKQDKADRKRYRHSAPPTEWVALMATLEERENNAAGPNNARQSRSKSPSTDVRYRFDGTLEKPYVYPGGLTFKGEPKKKEKKLRLPSKKGSKKGQNVTEVEVHQEGVDPSNRDVVYYDSENEYDESDIRKQFYLRYDSHIRKNSSKRDRRYSMPLELHRTGSDSPRYGRGESRWVDRKPIDDVRGSDVRPTGRFVGDEEIYDEPYESEAEENRRHLMENAREVSLYSKSPPLKDSECVYMWHSCEDLQKCDVQYHSEEEIRSSRENLHEEPVSNIKNYQARGNGHNKAEDKRPNNLDLPLIPASPPLTSLLGPKLHHAPGMYHQEPSNVEDENKDFIQDSLSSHPQHSVDSCQNNSRLSNIFLHSPVDEQDYPDLSHNYSGQEQSHTWHSPHRDHQEYQVNEKNSNESPPTTTAVLREQLYVKNSHTSPKSHSAQKDQQQQPFIKPTKPFDNPFRRNHGRSSCMPGNKRFFLPPPPTYTPPREEFQIALAKMAADENEEDEVQTAVDTNEKNRRSMGSQTDLTEAGKGDYYVVDVDMVDRDKSLASDNGSEDVFLRRKDPQTETFSDHISKPTIDILKGNLGSLPRNATTTKTNDQNTSPVLRNRVSSRDNPINKSYSGNYSDSVVYHNLPPKKLPRKLSSPSPTPTSPNSQSQSSHSHRSVVTSTPKAHRKSDLSIKPVPYPRKRYSSNLDYSSDSLPPASGDSCTRQQSQSQQQQQKDSTTDSIHQQAADGKQCPPSTSVAPSAVSSKPPERPVAKKRLSQLLSSDSSYTHADIEDGLEEDGFTPPRAHDAVCSDGDASKTTRRELFSNENDNPLLHGGHEKRIYSPRTNFPRKSELLEVIEDCNSKSNSKSNSKNTINDSSSNSSSISSDTSIHNHKENASTTPKSNAKSSSSAKDSVLPPLKRLQLVRSPTTVRRRFSSALSSSVECLSSRMASTYYSGLSSSMADIPSLMEKDLNAFSFDQLIYDDDDDADDENADDEMSVHNEESPLPKTPSLQNLLLSRSILDRSQAVARKRRQRLRNRKCRSQLVLSSLDVDEYYYMNLRDVRRRPSRHSSKQKQACGNNNTTDHLTTTTAVTATSSTATTNNAFSFDHLQLQPGHVQSRRALYRNSKLLNHTDSGMDSDGASPFNSRDFQQARELSASPPKQDARHDLVDWQVAENVLDKQSSSSSRGGDEAGGGGLGTLSNRKSWESRFHERQGLKKFRSREFLANVGTSRYLEKNVSVSNGFETLV